MKYDIYSYSTPYAQIPNEIAEQPNISLLAPYMTKTHEAVDLDMQAEDAGDKVSQAVGAKVRASLDLIDDNVYGVSYFKEPAHLIVPTGQPL